MNIIILTICALIASVFFALFFGAFAAVGTRELTIRETAQHDEHEELAS